MEASVAPTIEAPPEPEPSHDGAAEATRSTEELFQWSGYVHVGGNADECVHGVDGQCEHPPGLDPETGRLGGHFHAWVCLPNSFQIRDITDKARAARARKRRALRDPESDSYAILEAELDDVIRDEFPALLDALGRGEIDKHIPDMVERLKEDDRFKHQAQDAEEYNRLAALPEDDRDEEEFKRLEQDMAIYAEELQKEIDAQHEKEVKLLENLPVDEVRELERKARIDNIATETYLHTYYTWAMFVCSREPCTGELPSRRKFSKPEDLKSAPPEVVVALREKLKDLEGRMVRGDAAGN